MSCSLNVWMGSPVLINDIRYIDYAVMHVKLLHHIVSIFQGGGGGGGVDFQGCYDL